MNNKKNNKTIINFIKPKRRVEEFNESNYSFVDTEDLIEMFYDEDIKLENEFKELNIQYGKIECLINEFMGKVGKARKELLKQESELNHRRKNNQLLEQLINKRVGYKW